MTTTTFYSLVLSMRNAQKRYFKTRSRIALEDSKRLEKIVDEAVDHYFNEAVGLLFGPNMYPDEK